MYRRDLECAPAHLAAVRDGLLRRIGFGRDDSADWPRRFSPLVLLYPELQTERIASVAPEAAARAALAHMYFLVFSVIDDRKRDVQIVLTPEELEFAAWLFERGLQLLSGLIPDEELETLAGLFADRYEQGSQKLNREGSALNLTIEECRDIVVGRSFWGLFATLTLLLLKTKPQVRVEIARAFEWLVWGIQWADDIEDWRDDLRTGDDNLLLLHAQLPVADPVAVSLEVRFADTSQVLLDQNAIFCACEQAHAAFMTAADIQERIGCSTLASLIRERAMDLDRISLEAVRACENDVLAGQCARVAAAHLGMVR